MHVRPDWITASANFAKNCATVHFHRADESWNVPLIFRSIALNLTRFSNASEVSTCCVFVFLFFFFFCLAVIFACTIDPPVNFYNPATPANSTCSKYILIDIPYNEYMILHPF